MSSIFLLLDLHADEEGDEGGGEDDEEDTDGTDEEVLQEPGLVLRNAVIQFAEILPKRCIAIDGAHRERLIIPWYAGVRIHEKGYIIILNGREKLEVLAGMIFFFKCKQEAVSLPFGILDAGECEAIEIIGIEESGSEHAFSNRIGACFIGELHCDGVTLLESGGSEEKLDSFEIVSLCGELLRESLSGINLLYLISIESLRIGKCDECGESEK